MATILEGLGQAVDWTSVKFNETSKVAQKGLWVTGEKSSQALYDMYSLRGFENSAKFSVAWMRAASLFPSYKGVFDETIKTLDAQKELMYATGVFETTADFIKVTRVTQKDPETEEELTDPDTGEILYTGDKTYSFTLPRDKSGKIDWIKLLYGIGNPFDTACFLMKYKVISLPYISKVAAHIGSLKVFSLGDETWKFRDIPVLNSLVNRPKEFFVFTASVLAAYRSLRSNNFWDIENLLKLTSNIGKIILISSGERMLKNNFMVTLTLVDLVTQNAALFSFLLRCSVDRDKRFNDPIHF